MKNIIIIGASGHGKVVADIVRASGDKVIGFLDDDPKANRIGAVYEYDKFSDAEFIIAIGNAEIREKIARKIKVKWYTAIHPSAVISPNAKIEEGTVVMANTVINADAKVGKHCIINSTAVVEHEDQMEDFVHVSVGAKLGGAVKVGKSTWIGMGAIVINNVSICGGCMIGAGAVVVDNIDMPGTYIGVPAKHVMNN